jgi:Protein of unknown function (DUF3572)
MLKEKRNNQIYSAAAAAELALELVTYLAGDDNRLQRFLEQSGIGAGELRDRLNDPAFLGFVLDFALQDEELVVAFAAENSISPEALMMARSKLPGANLDF